MYYFEPTSSVMSEYQVGINIGSIVLTWHESRQSEIGLFKAYSTPYPTNYPKFSQKVTGSVWVRYETDDDLSISLGVFDGRELRQYPVYIQEWTIENLDEAEQEALRNLAQEVVAAEIESRLGPINAWASAKHIASTSTPISTAVKNAINSLFALNSTEGYPFTLADAVHTGTYAGWPAKLSSYGIQQLVDPV